MIQINHYYRLANIKFRSPSFIDNLFIFLLLWPVWWILGIDQLIPALFLGWEFIRYLIKSKGKFIVNSTILWTFFSALWWVIPIFWVQRADFDVFLKAISTTWAQLIFLILFVNEVKTVETWKKAVLSLNLLSIYFTLAGLIFILNIWTEPITTFIRNFIPASLLESSNFFNDISMRNLGVVTEGLIFVSKRVISLSYRSGSLATILLIFIPLTYWRITKSKQVIKFLWIVQLMFLILLLYYTDVRTAYVSFIFGVGFYLFLIIYQNRRGIWLYISTLLLLSSMIISTVLILTSGTSDDLISTFVESRSSARITIYRETLLLIPEHIIAGWGHSVQIPELSSGLSAGTHNSYLGSLFQHGIVGFIIHIALWTSVLKIISYRFNHQKNNQELNLFFNIAASALFALNIRIFFTNWWFDQSTALAIWSLWGLIIVAPKILDPDSVKTKN